MKVSSLSIIVVIAFTYLGLIYGISYFMEATYLTALGILLVFSLLGAIASGGKDGLDEMIEQNDSAVESYVIYLGLIAAIIGLVLLGTYFPVLNSYGAK
jgi:hypothetical protein